MQANIQPDYQSVSVKCSCGVEFSIKSTLGSASLPIDVCHNCHPFYTGKQRILDRAGQVDRFNRKYGHFAENKSTKTKEESK